MDEIVSSYPRRYTEKFSPGPDTLYKTCQVQGRRKESITKEKKARLNTHFSLFTRNNINASV